MTNGGKNVDFPIGYPSYLAPECLEMSDEYGFDKRDIWATGVILAEQYTRNSFWTTSDVGLIFDSLMTIKEWYEEDPSANVWNHSGIESLDINKSVLKFLQTEPEKDTEEYTFYKLVLGCLNISLEDRFDTTKALSSEFFKDGVVSVNAKKWVEGPILASDVVEPETIDTINSKSQEDINGMLHGLPSVQIYNLWKLAGGDVELDLVKRGVFLSTPVIKRLPRICLMPDGTEIGDKVTDTAQLYSDAIYVLGFKELYQRLEEGRKKSVSAKFEWDTDYFILVDENDVNFLLEEDSDNTNGIDDENNTDSDDMIVASNDFIFTDELSSSPPTESQPSSAIQNGIPTPTTPSSSRSLSRNASAVGMGRARSMSSLSMNSTASIPNQSNLPKLPLFLREQDINYQHYRQTLFSELLLQYPASRKEILHHAKVDIPPLLRGKVWAAVLGVKGDIENEYNQVDKYAPMSSDRQVSL